MIAFATRAMVPALKQIWRVCFGDAEEQIDFYFSERFCPENTLVALEKEHPAAMLTLLPAELVLNGEPCPVRYIYAVATLPARRGAGYSTLLLEYANRWVREQGGALTLLAPAGEALFSFYEKRGYTPSFFIKTAEFRAETPAACNFLEITAQEYKKLRDARFAGEGFLCWDETAIDYALRENRLNGGFSCKILSEYGQAAALCVKIEQTLLVRETTLPDMAVPPVLSALALRHGCGAVSVKLPAQSALAGGLAPLGMTSVPLQGGGYLNLILD